MRARRVTRALVVASLFAALFAGSVAIPSAPSGAGTTSAFYLDVGASASLGVQPTGNPKHNGAFTDLGYANDVVRLEAAKGVTVDLEKTGCMGETAQTMAGVGDHCYKLPSTQLSAAVAFLRAHYDDVGLVTVDIGFNDVRPCLWVVPLAGKCATDGIIAVRRDLPTILHALKAAAGPQVHFVGLTYADPFLYRYLKAAPGPARAQQSLTYMTTLDSAVSFAYKAAGFSVADVAAVFKSADSATTTMAPYGTIPVNVANVCRWTWMCAPRPYGPDDHPNKAGYLIIAQTIVAALPRSL